jgi:pilus assembly protein Flp/PilA
MCTISSFLRDTSGATSIEYAMLASGIAMVIISTVTSLGSTVEEMWNSISNALK